MIVCAGNGEEFSYAAAIGVGGIESSIELTRIILSTRPNFLLFIGSAGSYGKKGIFEIVHSQSACNIENSFLSANSYTPIDNFITSSSDVSRETIINSSNYITTSKEISKKYLEKNIDLENMEFFSVMSVAKRFSIPAGGLFVVTNYCDKDAHKDFLSNRVRAMKLLNSYIYDNSDKIFQMIKS